MDVITETQAAMVIEWMFCYIVVGMRPFATKFTHYLFRIYSIDVQSSLGNTKTDLAFQS